MREVVICGGGIGGAATAGVLSNLGHSVTLLEKSAQQEVGSVKRGETLRAEVCRVLTRFGFMPSFNGPDVLMRRGEKRELWHFELGKLGEFRYDYLAPEYPVIHSSHQRIVTAVYARLANADNIKTIFESQVISIGEFRDGRRKVVYKSRVDGTDHELSADLVVVADGATSRLRSMLWIPTEQYDYGVGYLMFYLKSPNELPWGRYCLGREGFVGVFPTGGNLIRAAVEVKVSELKDWLTATSAEHLKRLSKRSKILEGSEIKEKGAFYHVVRRHASKYTLDGLCLLGDAAHTTHPMQAQGMSMVFNDIEALYSVFEENPSGSLTNDVLLRYEEKARPFNTSVIETNHALFGYFQMINENKKIFASLVSKFEGAGFQRS